MLAANADGLFPYTPPTNLLYGLREALVMLAEEGLEHVFARHRRHAEATRMAVRAWGLEVLCEDPARYSSSLTAVLVGAGDDADQVRRVALDRYDLSLGRGPRPARRDACSASGTWGRSTTSCWPARSAGSS